jgi:glycosyltransferase 2 family protein
LKKALQYILMFGIAGVLVWLSLKNIEAKDWQQMKADISKANFWLILPVALMSFLSHWSRAMRWRILMQPLNIEVKRFNAFAAVMIGYFANMGVPRLGEVLKCSVLAKYEKAPADKLLGTIVVERAFDMVCFLIFIGITLLVAFDKIGTVLINQLKKLVYNDQGELNYLKIVIVLVTLLAIIIGLKLIFKTFGNNKIIKKIKGITDNIASGLTAITKLKNKKMFLVHTLIIWTMYTAQIYIAFFALEKTQHLDFEAALSTLSAGTIAMIVTPNGLGGFPIFVQEILQLYGVDALTGTSFGWIMWSVMTAIVIILGSLSFILLPRLNKINPNPTHEQSKQFSTENI